MKTLETKRWAIAVAGSAPCLVAIQEQDDLPEVFAQELLLAEG